LSITLSQCIGEEGAEHRFLPAVMLGMDRPDLRIAGNGEQRVPVLRRQWAKQQPLPFKDRLLVHLRR
jgi:hypothetical protein